MTAYVSVPEPGVRGALLYRNELDPDAEMEERKGRK